MGLALLFFAIPSTRGHIPDNRLGVVAHCDVLNRCPLFSPVRYRFSVSICEANVLASLFSARSACSCPLFVVELASWLARRMVNACTAAICVASVASKESFGSKLPLGAPPLAPWKRHTFHPRTAGALHRWRVRFEVAVQRGDLSNAYCSVPCCGFMGLALLFFAIPSTRGHIPDNRLGVVAHCDVLNRYPLLSPGTVSLQRFDL